MSAAPPETALYAPVKAFLASQGYEAKGEVGPCDLLARRGEEEPLAVELKRGFTLALVMQGVARQALFERVALAVPAAALAGRRRRKDALALCRRLGLGLLLVSSAGAVEAALDPGAPPPRRNTRARGAILREFTRRDGDPNEGGSGGRRLMTAYRQEAIRLAAHLAAAGPTRPAEAGRAAGAPRAGAILRDNHYGWFKRVSRGVYTLTEAGEAAAAAPPHIAPSPLPPISG